MSSRPSPTVVALLVAVALWVGWAWWMNKGKPAKLEREEQALRIFPELKDDGPAEITVSIPGSPNVDLKKVDGAWRILAPIQAGVEIRAIDGLLDQLKFAKREEVVVEKDADLKEFALDRPSGIVSFKGASATAKGGVLSFGSANPTGAQAYAMVSGRPEVFLTSSTVKSGLLKDADALRDKALWDFEVADVQRVDSTLGAGYTLERGKDGAWQVTRPVRKAAKGEEVKNFLQSLKDLRIEKFVDEEGKNLGKYGLSQGRIELKTTKQGVALQLTRGKEEAPSKGRYFQVKGRPQVFTLPAYSHTMMDQQADHFIALPTPTVTPTVAAASAAAPALVPVAPGPAPKK